MANDTAERAGERRRHDAGGTAIDPAQISESLKSLLSAVPGGPTADHVAMQRHVSELIGSLESLRSEIRNLQPNKIWQEHIPVASDELDAIVQATEDATNRIMSAAEVADRIAGSLDAAPSAELTDAVTSIYEACTFQDITGQRVKKVVRTLQHIETVVGAMAGRFGLGQDACEPAPAPESEDPEAKLLNGSALPGDAQSQADIDALFSS